MPKISIIEKNNEKKLIITDFFQDSLDEGETEAWITIHKMPYSLKRKVSLLAMESMNNKASKAFIKKLSESGKTMEELDNIKDDEALKIMLDFEFDIEEQRKVNEYGLEVEKLILENCVDPTKHNFSKKDGSIIDISQFDFWETIGNEKLIKFIINEIKSFSENFELKKKTATESTMPSDA